MEPVCRLIRTYWLAELLPDSLSRWPARIRLGEDANDGGYSVSQDVGTSGTGSVVTNVWPSGDSARSLSAASETPSCLTSNCLPPTTAQSLLCDESQTSMFGSSGQSIGKRERPVATI